MQGYELRIKQLLEDLAAARRALSEREEVISKLRIEVHEHSTRVINIKVQRLWLIVLYVALFDYYYWTVNL